MRCCACLTERRIPADTVFAVSWSRSSGDTVASGAADDRAFLWRVSRPTVKVCLAILPLAVSPHFNVESNLCMQRGIWSAASQAGAEDGYTCELRGHTDTVSATAFSSDGSLLATAGLDGM